MAAPYYSLDAETSEPTYCKLKHSINAVLKEHVNEMKTVVGALVSTQMQHERILSEAKMLHIMIYKRNNQLRKDKSLQLVKRVQACMKRITLFGKLYRMINDMHKDFLSAASQMKDSGDVYLPAQQMWSYILYLQWQYTKLLEATQSYCVVAFEHLSCHFATGMLIPQMLVFMGIVARIWLLSRTLNDKVQMIYNKMYPMRENIERTQSGWKEPQLPFPLQCHTAGGIDSVMKEKLSAASKMPVKSTAQAMDNITNMAKDGIIPDGHEEEDIGELVAITPRPSQYSSSHRKRKLDFEESSPVMKRKKKEKSKSGKQLHTTEEEFVSKKQKKKKRKTALQEKLTPRKKTRKLTPDSTNSNVENLSFSNNDDQLSKNILLTEPAKSLLHKDKNNGKVMPKKQKLKNKLKKKKAQEGLQMMNQTSERNVSINGEKKKFKNKQKKKANEDLQQINQTFQRNSVFTEDRRKKQDKKESYFT